jgi:hypothetical protein
MLTLIALQKFLEEKALLSAFLINNICVHAKLFSTITIDPKNQGL